MSKKVLVIAEVRNGELRNVSFEAIAAGKRIAEGGEIVSVLLGENVDHLGQKLLGYGSDRVLAVNHKDLQQYTTDAYKQALLQVIEKENPDGIIMGHTAIGKDLSPRLAVKLYAGLVSDVIALEQKDGEWVFTRPIYSGKAFENKKNKGRINLSNHSSEQYCTARACINSIR